MAPIIRAVIEVCVRAAFGRHAQEGLTMKRWLGCALDYIPRWLEFQVRMLQQPGCVVAIAHRDKVVLEQGFGSANLASDDALSPRHRFRIGSFSPKASLRRGY
jgi:CubicO group peptidase (beta-lactamase class C family)